MANLIAISGESGTGKSTSLFANEALKIKGLDPTKTVLINVASKPLPVRGAKGLYPAENYIVTEDAKEVANIISNVSKNRPAIENVVIDDAGYLMGLEVMKRAYTKGYDKWIDLAVGMMAAINAARSARKDLSVIFMFHLEKSGISGVKIKTSGAMIDNNILLDGLFTIILYSEVRRDHGKKPSYAFRSLNSGSDTCKAPYGMFEDEYIPNDLGLVLDKMNKYYNGGE